jgi:hypothetical protein
MRAEVRGEVWKEERRRWAVRSIIVVGYGGVERVGEVVLVCGRLRYQSREDVLVCTVSIVLA